MARYDPVFDYFNRKKEIEEGWRNSILDEFWKRKREREEKMETERQRPRSHLLPPITPVPSISNSPNPLPNLNSNFPNTIEEWREHAKLFPPLFHFYRTMR